MAGRAAKPTRPKWSSRMETNICPAMVMEMKVAAPRRGAKAAVNELARDIAPIDDVRSTARYRLRVAQNLLAEFLSGLA